MPGAAVTFFICADRPAGRIAAAMWRIAEIISSRARSQCSSLADRLPYGVRSKAKPIALVGLFAVLMLLAAWRLHAWSRMGVRPSPDEYVTYQLECLECGHRFDRKMGDMPDEARARPGQAGAPVVNPAAIRADCPDCGASRSAAMLATCYQCRERFVSAFAKAEPGQSPPTEDVCPHCGIDVMAGARAAQPPEKKAKPKPKRASGG